MTGQTTIPANRSEIEAALERELQRSSPGAHLPSERALADRYGVGRPLVREALRALAERGLVEISPGRGAFVRAFRANDIARPIANLFRRSEATGRDLLEAREMFESTAAGLAAGRRTPQDLADLGAMLDALDASTNIVDQARLDLAFHAVVARSAHNPVLEMLFTSMSNLVFEFMLRSLSDPTVRAEGLPYHRRVFEAIERRDGDEARALMTEHLALARRLYGDDLTRRLDDLARDGLSRLAVPDTTLDDLLGSLSGHSEPTEA